MQDIHSDERYSQFTQAIIDAAERRAEALITGAEREKAEMLRAAVNNGSQTEYNRLSTLALHNRGQLKAGASQSMRRELLQYRECLVQQLAQRVRARCEEFANGDDYTAYLQNKLNRYANALAQGSATIYVRSQDVNAVTQLCKQYNNANVLADIDIALGGIRLAIDNKIYDETLDASLEKEQEKFLSYCGLRVV